MENHWSIKDSSKKRWRHKKQNFFGRALWFKIIKIVSNLNQVLTLWICIWILAFSTNFCLIKIELSGNTVWPKTQFYQKLAIFGVFKWIFVHSKWKRSSLRSQYWLRLFLGFSNTVGPFGKTLKSRGHITFVL